VRVIFKRAIRVEIDTFLCQQPTLPLECFAPRAASEAAEGQCGGNHPVTGNLRGERIDLECLTDGTGASASNRGRDRRIGADLASGNASHGIINGTLEGGTLNIAAIARVIFPDHILRY